MPYQPTGGPPGRPFADPEKEAERQRKWKEKQAARDKRIEDAKQTTPEPRAVRAARPKGPPEVKLDRAIDKLPGRRREKDAKRKAVFGGAVSKQDAEKPFVPTFGFRQPSRVERRVLRPRPAGG